MGNVAPGALKKLDITQPVCFASLNWRTVCRLAAKAKVKFADLPKTPPVRRDLALLVDKEVTYDKIRATVEQAERKLLKSVNLFDVYEGKNLEPGKKSYAISVILQDDNKTMQDKQIDAIMAKIIKSLERETGAKLR